MLQRKLVKIPKDVSEVTRIATDTEVPPESVGLERSEVDAIWRTVEGLYRSRVHPAIGFCLRKRGQVVIDRTIGHASGNGPDDPVDGEPTLATPDTLFCLFSASKAITAMLVHLLDERGQLHVDDRVCEYIPEFANNGKDKLTIRHILSHTAGLPTAGDHNGDMDLLLNWDGIIELLCDAAPAWVPDRKLGYHALTGGFILGEIIRRVDGRDVRKFMRDEILDPLGFDAMDFGVPRSRLGDVAVNRFTGAQPPFPLGMLFSRAIGAPVETATELSNDPRFLTGIVPSGNICATPNETSRFYQLLLNEGELDGVRIFEPRTVRRAVHETSYGIPDKMLGLPIRYGLGFMLGHQMFSLYGPDTEDAFGHIGFTEVWTWADPKRELSVALLTTGKPFLDLHLIPMWKMLSAISRHG